MSNYTKATNFTAKDTLPTGNSVKIIKGTEIDTELTAVASAIASKADSNSPTFTGTPSGPTASAGTNSTQLATTAFVGTAITNATGSFVDESRTITAGTGLSGGGDLSADRTLSISNSGVTAGTYGSSSAIPSITVNAQGQITSASTNAVSTPTLTFGDENFAYVQECSGSGVRTLKYNPPNVVTGVAVSFESGACGRMANYLGVYYRSISIS